MFFYQKIEEDGREVLNRLSIIELFYFNKPVMKEEIYPASPLITDATILAPSGKFKSEIAKVLFSIFLFVMVYLLLVVIAAGLFVACVAGGIGLIIALPRFITLMVGLGLIGLGVMVMVFLVKFIFSVKRYDTSDGIEVFEEDLPELFAFIRKLSKDTNVRFPKKIILTPDVNAAVFYDSSFWSMFFPVRKNLKIGLGLVNSLSVSEFKAVIAHEFGHFSQRSMKLGSYVYQVNRVIYNMLFENTGYQKSLESFARMSRYFAFFAQLTVLIARGIQWVLRHMYHFVNKGYMALSREMEFHADAVAAIVSGSENCVFALRHVEIGDSCYNEVINKCNEWVGKQKFTENVYPLQRIALQQFASTFSLPLENSLPAVDKEVSFREKITRVDIKNQWASHPTTPEREDRLLAINVQAEKKSGNAWILFDNPEKWQKKLTDKLYENVRFKGMKQAVEPESFRQEVADEQKKFSIPKEYNGYYDNRTLDPIAINELAASVTPQSFTIYDFENLFSSKQGEVPKKLLGARIDVQTLTAIESKQLQAASFDFAGEKFEAIDAEMILRKLNNEVKTLSDELKASDEKAFQFFYWCALNPENNSASDYLKIYEAYQEGRIRSEDFSKLIEAIQILLSPIFAGQTLPHKQINELISDLRYKYEPGLKKHLTQYLSENAFDGADELKKHIEQYLASTYLYFTDTIFLNDEIHRLYQVLNEGPQFIYRYRFLEFRKLLLHQLEIYRNLKMKMDSSLAVSG